jgi:hypothetical protein
MSRAEQAGHAIMPKNRQSEPALVSGKAVTIHGRHGVRAITRQPGPFDEAEEER